MPQLLESALLERQLQSNSTSESTYSDNYERDRLGGARRRYPSLEYTEWRDKRPVSNRISTSIEEAIQSSRKMLKWPDDWDGEGSKKFKFSTWDRAITWLRETALSFRKHYGFWVTPPQIFPAPEGSIDLHWETAKFELLINFPESLEDAIEFYGRSGQKDEIKGKLDISQTSEWIFAWLMK